MPSFFDIEYPPGSREAGGQASSLVIEAWEVAETAVPRDGDIPLRETIFSVGNGFVGVRGYHDSVDSNLLRYAGVTSVSNKSSCVTTPRSDPAASCAAFTTPHPGPFGHKASSPLLGLQRSAVFESSLTQNPVAGPTMSHRGTYLNGVYDESVITHVSSAFSSGCCKRECFMVNVPDALDVELFVDGERVTPLLSPERVTHYRRSLDLKTGELRRKFTWKTTTGVDVSISESRFACASRKNLVATRLSVAVEPSATNPSSVDVKVLSRTTLPCERTEAADFAATVGSMRYATGLSNGSPSTPSHCWEVESQQTDLRLEDVSSVLSVRTKRSRKHVTIATNERCAVTVTDPSNATLSGPTVLAGMCPSGSTTGFGETPTFATPLVNSPPLPIPASLLPQQSEWGSGNVSTVRGQQVLTTFIRPCKAPSSQEAHSVCSDDVDAASKLSSTFHTSLTCTDANASITFVKYVAYVTETDCDIEDLEVHAKELIEAAVDISFEGLLAEQVESMEKFWASSDLPFKCNQLRAQGALRFNLLQLFMSTGRWKNTGVGPRGLTGEVFNGLQSWDAEIFVVPFFVHTNPAIARSLLQFRVDTLHEAMHRALELELPRGAVYPSRTINGAENAPSLTCCLHLHVNADISYAIQQYYEATDDADFLIKGGLEVVWQTALAWLEWGSWEKGVFHLRNITGPDEYNVLIDDNYYTNLMAQHHMHFAVAIYNSLRSHPSTTVCNEVETIRRRVQLSDEDFVAFGKAAVKMALPYDPHHRIHLQDASFMRKPSWDKVMQKDTASGGVPGVGGLYGATAPLPLRASIMTPSPSGQNFDALVGGDTTAPHQRRCTSKPSGDWDTAPTPDAAAAATPRGARDNCVTPPHAISARQYLPGSESGPMVMIQEYHPVVVFRHRICKTADVVQAAVLLRDKFTRDEKEANLRFYEALTAHDSSLTAPMFCIASADVQIRDKASDYFKYTLFVDTHNILKNTSGGLHLSCLAASWMCIVAGFGGFSSSSGVAHFNPWMPDGWEEYKFNVRHHGATIQVAVTRRAVTYTLVDGAPKLLIIHAQNSRVHLAKSRPVNIRLVRDVRSIDFDGVVFDLDSLIDSVEEDHFEAWRDTLDPVFSSRGADATTGRRFNNEMYLAYLRHHPISSAKRHHGLQKLLKLCGIDNIPVGEPTDTPSDSTMYGLIATKLRHFRRIVKERGVHIRDGSVQLLSDLRENGVAIGVVSASKNGGWMMQQAPAVLHLVDYFVDANIGEEQHLKWRPELDFFDFCTKRMESTSGRTVIFVDGIDGFSKKSLQNYWLVINTSEEDAVTSWNAAGSSGAAALLDADASDEVNPLHVTDFTSLSTDVLQERGAFMPARRMPSSSNFFADPTKDSVASPHVKISNSSLIAPPPMSLAT